MGGGCSTVSVGIMSCLAECSAAPVGLVEYEIDMEAYDEGRGLFPVGAPSESIPVESLRRVMVHSTNFFLGVV